MKKNENYRQELLDIFNGMSIYQMSVWMRDHAQYLKWFRNYDERKIDDVIQRFLALGQFMSDNFRDDVEAISDFKELSIKCVEELEINCR